MVGYIQPTGDASCVPYILQRTAGFLSTDSDIIIIEQFHGYADTVEPLLFH
jgi:hypothetical protein